MLMLTGWVLSTTGLTAAMGLALGAPAEDGRVRMEVMPGVRAVVPGTTFLVGVNLEIEPEWHIYWLNPGDSGVPTAVDVDVPAGFKINRVMFPGPERIETGDGSVSYGYEEEVLLLIEIAAPEEFEDASFIDIDVRADWLVCKKACFAGSGSGSVRLKVGRTGDEVKTLNRTRFARWLGRVPAALETLGKDRFFWRGSRAEPTLSMVLESGDEVEYFPLETDGVLVSWQVIESTEGRGVMRFEATYEIAEPSADPAPALGVVKIANAETVRYYEVVHGFDE